MAIADRFPTAANSSKPTEQQVAQASLILDDVLELAERLDAKLVDGRWKSLALTALEEALMWANKSLFNEVPKE